MSRTFGSWLILLVLVGGGAPPNQLAAQFSDLAIGGDFDTRSFQNLWLSQEPYSSSSSSGLVGRALLGNVVAIAGVYAFVDDTDYTLWPAAAVPLLTAALPLMSDEAEGRRWWIAGFTLVGASAGLVALTTEQSEGLTLIAAEMLTLGGALYGILASGS